LKILKRHGRNIRAKQTRMRGTTNGMSHGYKEEIILVGCEDVSWCALSLGFFIPPLTMPDLLVKKQQSSPRKRYKPPFSAVRRSSPLLFCKTIATVESI
jgi:hypothetical protein